MSKSPPPASERRFPGLLRHGAAQADPPPAPQAYSKYIYHWPACKLKMRVFDPVAALRMDGQAEMLPFRPGLPPEPRGAIPVSRGTGNHALKLSSGKHHDISRPRHWRVD
jgi:hypothetical protein